MHPAQPVGQRLGHPEQAGQPIATQTGQRAHHLAHRLHRKQSGRLGAARPARAKRPQPLGQAGPRQPGPPRQQQAWRPIHTSSPAPTTTRLIGTPAVVAGTRMIRPDQIQQAATANRPTATASWPPGRGVGVPTGADRQTSHGHAQRHQQHKPPGETNARLAALGIFFPLLIGDPIVDQILQLRVQIRTAHLMGHQQASHTPHRRSGRRDRPSATTWSPQNRW